jgi:hypothetical protein
MERKDQTFNTDYLYPKEVASLYGFSVSRLAVWRRRGNGPKYHDLGHKTKIYYKKDIDNYISERGRYQSKSVRKIKSDCLTRRLSNVANEYCDSNLSREFINDAQRLIEELSM